MLSCLHLISFSQANSLLHQFIVSDNIAQISAKIKIPKLSVPVASLIITNTNYSCDPSACSVLPVQFLSFDAKRVSNDLVEVSWKTTNEINNKLFIVERSWGNTIVFTEVGSVEADHFQAALHEYKMVDKNDFEKTSYYRLRQIDQNNEFTYSKILAVKGYQSRERITVFPNPANSEITLQIEFGKPSKVLIVILNNEGQKLHEQLENCAGGMNTYKFVVTSFKKGVYTFKVAKDDGSVWSKKFIRN